MYCWLCNSKMNYKGDEYIKGLELCHVYECSECHEKVYRVIETNKLILD